MPIRDLGYRPYEGKRLPPSHGTTVIFRHGLGRVWSSWLVKLATFFSWVPTVITLSWVAITWFASQGNPMVEPPKPASVVFGLAQVQLWLFVTLVTLGAGASTVAEDLAFKALPLYFSKPLTPRQYLFGRTGAVALWSFLMVFLPCATAVAALAATAPDELRLETAGVVLPTLLYATLVAACCGILSVGVSALGRSRALTMTSWILVFLVPHVLAVLVEAVGEWPWLRLLSLPGLLAIVGEALFRIEPVTDLRWFHALPLLAAIVALSILLTYRRLKGTAVIE